jgi:hypothetical protein
MLTKPRARRGGSLMYMKFQLLSAAPPKNKKEVLLVHFSINRSPLTGFGHSKAAEGSVESGHFLSLSAIPKGLCPPAQGCEERATLGNGPEGIGNPNGVVPTSLAYPSHNPVGVGNVRGTIPQGSSSLATLGFEPKSLWDFPIPFSRSDNPCKVERGRANSAVAGFDLCRRLCRSADCLYRESHGPRYAARYISRQRFRQRFLQSPRRGAQTKHREHGLRVYCALRTGLDKRR